MRYKTAMVQTANILRGQKANVLFYRRTPYAGIMLQNEVEHGQYAYGFRRGTMPISVPRDCIKQMLNQGFENREILFSPNEDSNMPPERDIDENVQRLRETFQAQGVSVVQKFVKGLLIAAYGSYGELRVIDPQYGVENISNSLIRSSSFVDCRVFNPNLGGMSRLEHILENESFGFIGMSPIVIDQDLLIMNLINGNKKGTLTIAGGPVFSEISPETFLRAFPVDAAAIGAGEDLMLEIAAMIRSNPLTVLETLCGHKNVWVFEDGKIQAPTVADKIMLQMQHPLQDDVPLQERDIYHNATYLETRKIRGVVLGDHIGRKPVVVIISDHCRGHCIFCKAPRNKMKAGISKLYAEVDRCIEEIGRKFETGDYDAVQVIDNNFTTHRPVVEYFCDQIIRNGLEQIPKSIKARADELCKRLDSPEPDMELIGLMKMAGIRRIYIGIESFNQEALDDMQKEVTVEQNENVLNALINEGIIPGLNIITFGGLNDTPEDVLNTVRKALAFIERGATLNATEFMGAGEGASVMGLMPDRIRYYDMEMPGMRTPLTAADYVYTNDAHYEFAQRAIDKHQNFLNLLRYQYPFQIFSTHVTSLALFWAVAHLKGDDAASEKIEQLIDDHICSQSSSILPFERTASSAISQMRTAFIDGNFDETISLYNRHLRQLLGSSQSRLGELGCSVEDLNIDPQQPVIDISSLAIDIAALIREMEKVFGKRLLIRIAGHPATGKTMLRNQLIKQGMKFELLNLDQHRKISVQESDGQIWQRSPNIEEYYDLSSLSDRFGYFPEESRVLFEGTWSLSPRFSLSKDWDLSIAFNYPNDVWRRFLWFRQILFRRKSLTALLPSIEQQRVYDQTYRDYILNCFGNADIIADLSGKIIASNERTVGFLKTLGIEGFRTAAFIDQLKYF